MLSAIMSPAMTSLRRGGKAYLHLRLAELIDEAEVEILHAYHDQNAMKKPNHEKKKTRPYLLKGLKKGMERAFLLMGLTSGSFHRNEMPMLLDGRG
jgi:hypothetical protein